MNIRDLRPGNLIRWVQTNEIVTVTGVFEDKREVTARKADGTNVEDIIDAFEGVDLTTDFLSVSGFLLKKDAINTYYVYQDDFILLAKRQGFYFAINYDEVALLSAGKPLNKAHSVQNLYRDLYNGEELEIKL